MFIRFLIFFFLGSTFVIAQQLTGVELLNKTIAYHDPNDSWVNFKGEFEVTMQIPNKEDRISDIRMNFPKEYFYLNVTRNGTIVTQTLHKDACKLALNGNTTISEADKKQYNISCERAKTMKNYYTYLYGLPMKLKDKGTIIDPKVTLKTFKGKEYLVLKATYSEDVGEDIWYFYFDPNTYAMEVYQFYHNEAKNDGEYILLEGLEEVSGIKMPKTRKWFYNKDDAFLGADLLNN